MSTTPTVFFSDGTKLWYDLDNQHRLDGPAVEWFDGVREYYIQGKQYNSFIEYIHDVIVYKELKNKQRSFYKDIDIDIEKVLKKFVGFKNNK